MRRKKAVLLATAVTIGTLALGSTVAYFTDQGTAVNEISMGKIGISLTEDQFDSLTDGTRAVEGVMPGDQIVKDPTVIVDGDSKDSYIRIRMEIRGDLSDQAKKSLADALDIKDGWYNAGNGLYYYKEVVHANEKIPFFTRVTIPETWENDSAGKEFKIDLTAEAVQQANFQVQKNAQNDITGWVE